MHRYNKIYATILRDKYSIQMNFGPTVKLTISKFLSTLRRTCRPTFSLPITPPPSEFKINIPSRYRCASYFTNYVTRIATEVPVKEVICPSRFASFSGVGASSFPPAPPPPILLNLIYYLLVSNFCQRVISSFRFPCRLLNKPWQVVPVIYTYIL